MWNFNIVDCFHSCSCIYWTIFVGLRVALETIVRPDESPLSHRRAGLSKNVLLPFVIMNSLTPFMLKHTNKNRKQPLRPWQNFQFKQARPDLATPRKDPETTGGMRANYRKVL
jgi:hypothetical protein